MTQIATGNTFWRHDMHPKLETPPTIADRIEYLKQVHAELMQREQVESKAQEEERIEELSEAFFSNLDKFGLIIPEDVWVEEDPRLIYCEEDGDDPERVKLRLSIFGCEILIAVECERHPYAYLALSVIHNDKVEWSKWTAELLTPSPAAAELGVTPFDLLLYAIEEQAKKLIAEADRVREAALQEQQNEREALRRIYAGHALQGLLASGRTNGLISRDAFAWADDMIAALEAGGGTDGNS